MSVSSRLICLISLMALLLGVFAARGEAAPKVLFDTGHGERFLIDKEGPLQLSGLAGICAAAGVEVAKLDKPIDDAALAGADGLVISGAFAPLGADEVEAVVRFMERGGRLAVMLHIAPPLSSLLDRIGIMYTNGVIEEREDIINGNPQDFWVKRFGSHPLLKGIERFSLYGVWGVINADDRGRVIASTGPLAWIDLQGNRIQTKEETGSFGVVCAGDLGKGGFLIFGDDAIFQNKYLDKDNRALAVNLAQWLRQRGEDSRDSSPNSAPLIKTAYEDAVRQ